jgi:pimeloyl-ACP methyl ester carboxylesterase
MTHLLLLHGAIGSVAQLQALKDKLSEHFHVHAFEFSGHGQTAFATDFSIAQFADELHAYIKANQLHQPHVLGYSMGGYVALKLAAEHPQALGKIMTLATKFHWDPETAAREIKMLNPEKIEEKLPAFAQILEARHQAIGWKNVLAKTAEMMIAMGNDNPLQKPDYEKISNPVRISIGDRDQMVTLEETIHVFRQIQNASFQIFPETPHPIEKMDLNQLVTALCQFTSAK